MCWSKIKQLFKKEPSSERVYFDKVSMTVKEVIDELEYDIEILGTTGLLDEIYVIGAEVIVTRLI